MVSQGLSIGLAAVIPLRFSMIKFNINNSSVTIPRVCQLAILALTSITLLTSSFLNPNTPHCHLSFCHVQAKFIHFLVHTFKLHFQPLHSFPSDNSLSLMSQICVITSSVILLPIILAQNLCWLPLATFAISPPQTSYLLLNHSYQILCL